MNENHFGKLLDEYITGKISGPDQKLFFELLDQEQYRKQLEQLLREDWEQGNYEEEPNTQVAGLIEHLVLARINEKLVAPVRSIPFYKKYRWAAAAVILLVISMAVLMVPRNSKSPQENGLAIENPPAKKIDIPPGSNGAILTLDNGEQIILDSALNGLIAQQGESRIVKQGEKLSYHPAGTATGVSYNTISTPNGKQYPNLVLADGSTVWLDAGSSIRFPVSFTGMERRVEITGQVWFDVVHNEKMPFKVMANGIEISDLGTQFNVHAYGNEQQTTVTLLEGVISIYSKLLSPGQQARISEGNSMQILNDVNTEDVIAWKSGFFSFRNTDVKGVMRQLSRWYDVEVRYEGVNPATTFTGKIDRNLNLSEVLKILEQTGVHFRIEEGKKLVILP